MKVNLKIKHKWPFSMFFKEKEATYEVPICESSKELSEAMKSIKGGPKMLAGAGYCRHCGMFASNLKYHEARCPKAERSIRAEKEADDNIGVC